jgi:hypothetical protein
MYYLAITISYFTLLINYPLPLERKVAAPTKDWGGGLCFYLFKKASKYIIRAIPNCNCESHQTSLTRISHKEVQMEAIQTLYFLFCKVLITLHQTILMNFGDSFHYLIYSN